MMNTSDDFETAAPEALSWITPDGRTSEGFLFDVINNLPLAVTWKSAATYEYLGCNSAFCQVAKMAEPRELVGKTDHDLPWGVEQVDKMREADEYVTSTGEALLGIVEKARKFDGTEGWASLSKIPLRDRDGNVSAILVTVEDVTDRKQAEETIEKQNRAILEMSTPVVKLTNGVLMVPLVGSIDTTRAQQMTSRLLEEVVNQNARAIIMDVTGVPYIDTSVARHILQSVDAARILGAEVILTGFSPEAAQTLSQLGVDFSSLQTRGSLQAGLQIAFQIAQTSRGQMRT